MTANPSAISTERAASLLYARLQVVVPEARSILLAWATSTDAAPSRTGSVSLAPALAEAYRVAGIEAVLLALPAESNRLLTRDELQKRLTENLLTVVEGGGLLDSPNTIVAVRSVDAVVVLVRKRRTRRSDLELASRELGRAGTYVAGAVLLD